MGKKGRGRAAFLSSGRFMGMVLLLILLLPVVSFAQNLTCKRLPMLFGQFLANHYAMKNLNGEVKAHTIDQMAKILDPSKTLLYESDWERLKPELQGIFAGMQIGDCSPLQQAYDLLVARARENETIVKNILAQEYKIDEDAVLDTDVNRRARPKTAADKKELLRKIVQFQTENSLLAGVDLAEAKKQQAHHFELQTRRVAEHSPEKLLATFAEAFAQALDPHTSYLSPENLADLKIHMQLSLEGIGAVLSGDNGFTVIEELIPGGGAERSGLLKPKDKIIAVAQEGETPVYVTDMGLRDVIRMIRGKKGTQVTLTILRQAEETERFDITITRDRVNIKEREAKITYENRTLAGRQYLFGVIDLPSFYGDDKENKSCYEDVKKLLAEAGRKNVHGIVLDLSRNAGGLLREAVRIAGLFIGKGGIVATKDGQERVTVLANGSGELKAKGDKIEVIKLPVEDAKYIYAGPLVVLTSRMSASASEIVAGALKDYRRGVIVGSDHTFGKGSVQELTPLPGNLGGMKVTRSLYFLPGGRSTQKMGVEADVRLPGLFMLQDIGETELDYPLPAQAIAPFLPASGKASQSWKPLQEAVVAELAARSKTRVAKDPKFAEIIRNNKEAAGKRGFIRLSDLRKKAEKKEGGGKKRETPAEVRKKARDQYAPFVNEGINILLDMATTGSSARATRAGIVRLQPFRFENLS